MMVDDDDGVDESFVEFLRHTDEQLDDNSLGLALPDVGSERSGAENPRAEVSRFSLGSFSVVGEEPRQQLESSSHESASSTSHFDVGKHVRIALQSQTIPGPKQLWETGVWASIFSDVEFSDAVNLFGKELERPAVPGGHIASDSGAETSMKRARRTESFEQVVKYRPDVSWKEQTDAALQSSVKLWYLVIQRWKKECSMYIETHEFRWESEALAMLLDIFAARSPYTLRKRALAVMRICDYLDENVLDSFPISERNMYAFLCSERNSGAPSSRLKGLMQAITFCRHVLDLTDLEETVNSARCRGTTRQTIIAERNQASPLKVKEVQQLHEVLSNGQDVWFQLFAGAALFCLYARARWGDLMRAEYVLVDCDSSGKACFLEARVGSHKTMQSQQHRHQFLPMVAPGSGVTGDPWIEQWLRVRQTLSLSLDEGRVMPAPQPDGSPGDRPLDSQEAAGWLRLILCGDPSPLKDRKVASHSLKATLLSYAAKRGVNIALRLQLGYHTQPFRMGLTYSRDGAAASLAALEQLLCEVRCGLFLPDETRSGRLVNAAMGSGALPIVIKDEDEPEASVAVASDPPPLFSSQPVALPVPEVEQSDTDSERTSGSEMEETNYEPSLEVGRFQPPCRPDGFVMWQHGKSRILHLMDKENVRVFVCGRSAGPLHKNEGLQPRYDTPICWSCFNKAQT